MGELKRGDAKLLAKILATNGGGVEIARDAMFMFAATKGTRLILSLDDCEMLARAAFARLDGDSK